MTVVTLPVADAAADPAGAEAPAAAPQEQPAGPSTPSRSEGTTLPAPPNQAELDRPAVDEAFREELDWYAAGLLDFWHSDVAAAEQAHGASPTPGGGGGGGGSSEPGAPGGGPAVPAANNAEAGASAGPATSPGNVPSLTTLQMMAAQAVGNFSPAPALALPVSRSETTTLVPAAAQPQAPAAAAGQPADLGPGLPDPYIVATVPDILDGGGSGPGNFRVFLEAANNQPLTVNYSVSGTATPGVDYQPLSGSVTIPAGASYADIPVNPLGDPQPDGNETVVVTLLPGSYILSQPTSATVTLHDNGQPPVAANDVYSVAHDSPLSIAAAGVLANDSDPNNLPLTASLASLTSHGSVVLASDGSFSYTPAPGYVGTDSFSYVANDGLYTSAPATVSLTVTDNAPAAHADSYGVPASTTIGVTAFHGVLANDTDADSDALTASLVSGPSHGALTLNSDGSFSYTPTTGYTGTDSFQYQASDGALASTATVTLTVHGTNTAPAAADSYSVPHDQALTVAIASGVLANDTDADADPLTAGVVSGPSHGTLILNSDGSFTYTPNAGYAGSDSFQYVANDGATNSAPATVALTMTDQAPTATAESYSVVHDQTLAVQPDGVLANDTDPDNEPLSAELVTSPARGTLTFNADGSFTYVPYPGFTGTDSFTYAASDEALQSAPATVTITVTNSTPTPQNDAYGIQANTTVTVLAAAGVLANDTDPNGDPLMASIVSGPVHGDLLLNDDGSFSYTPDPGFTGSDSFTCAADDGAATADATVTLTVHAANTAPAASGASYPVLHDQALTVAAGGVLAHASDADGDPLTAALVTGPTHGTLTLNADGSFTYTANAGFAGSDSFQYQASDGLASSSAATVSLTVNDPNVPTLTGASYTISHDALLTDSNPGLLSGAADADGDTLSLVLVSGPAHGTLSFGGDGSFDYTPAAGYVGSDAFSYYATDGVLNSATATAQIQVTNTAPEALNETYGVEVGAAVSVTAEQGLLAEVTDPEGDSLTAQVVGQPAHGTLTAFNSDGTFTYVPNAGFTGVDTFTYQADDGVLTSDPATVTITVENDPPVGEPDSYDVAVNGSLNGTQGSVLDNDYDPDGDTLQAFIVTAPTNASSFSLSTDGTFSYVPNVGFSGTDSFSYQVSDGTAMSDPITLTLRVSNAPDAMDDYYQFNRSQPVVVTQDNGLLANDWSPGIPDTTLRAELIDPPPPDAGTLALNDLHADGTFDGTFTFTPNGQPTGDVSFSYCAVLENGANQVVAVSPVATVWAVLQSVADGTKLVEQRYSGPTFYAIKSDLKNKGSTHDTYNESQWVDQKGAGFFKLNISNGDHWQPVSYVRGSRPVVTATFSVSAQAAAFIAAAKKKPNGLKIQGVDSDGRIYAVDVTKQVSLDLNKNTLTVKGVEPNQALPNKVAYLPFYNIQWQVSFVGGQKASDWITIGLSVNHLYVLYAPPVRGTQLYNTVVLKGTWEADGEATAAGVTSKVWRVFSKDDKNPANVWRADLQELHYYKDWTTRQPPFTPRTLKPRATFTEALLGTRDGTCGSWAMFFSDMLAAQGITYTKSIAEVSPTTPFEWFLVQNWQVVGPAGKYRGKNGQAYTLLNTPLGVDDTLDTANLLAKTIQQDAKGNWFYKWQTAAVKDQDGVPGQNTSNPLSIFPNHTMVKINNVYYDPSYGVKYKSRQDFQNKAIAAFVLDDKLQNRHVHLMRIPPKGKLQLGEIDRNYTNL